MAKKMFCTICERETDENCVLYCQYYADEDCIPIEDTEEANDGLQNN